MSRQLEQIQEERQRRADVALVSAVEFGLSGAIAHTGGVLLGFSAKLQESDCLLVLRARFPGGPQVCFVGADSLANALRKSVREGLADNLRWREDRYAG